MSKNIHQTVVFIIMVLAIGLTGCAKKDKSSVLNIQQESKEVVEVIDEKELYTAFIEILNQEDYLSAVARDFDKDGTDELLMLVFDRVQSQVDLCMYEYDSSLKKCNLVAQIVDKVEVRTELDETNYVVIENEEMENLIYIGQMSNTKVKERMLRYEEQQLVEVITGDIYVNKNTGTKSVTGVWEGENLGEEEYFNRRMKYSNETPLTVLYHKDRKIRDLTNTGEAIKQQLQSLEGENDTVSGDSAVQS